MLRWKAALICEIEIVLCFIALLVYAYCSSLNGCELWDLWNKNIDKVCVAWRKALRRVWNLPFNTHCNILFELSNALPVYDVMQTSVIFYYQVCA